MTALPSTLRGRNDAAARERLGERLAGPAAVQD